MSYKADTLLKTATSFERLSLYGDRKVYLDVLAQVSLPNTQALINAINITRMNIVKDINNFWRQNVDFPTAARIAYSALAYPQTDLTTAQGEQLTSAMDQFVTALDSIYRVLLNSGEQKFSQFAQQIVSPALENMQKQIEQFHSAQESVPKLSQLPEEMSLPEQTFIGYTPISKDIQADLNKLLGLHIKVDGKLGTETRNAINQFKAQYNMPNGATDMEAISLIRNMASR